MTDKNDKTWGGKREGAGRPKGRPPNRTLKQTQWVEETGLTPLHYLVNAYRGDLDALGLRHEHDVLTRSYVMKMEKEADKLGQDYPYDEDMIKDLAAVQATLKLMPPGLRIKSAIDAMPYVHSKMPQMVDVTVDVSIAEKLVAAEKRYRRMLAGEEVPDVISIN